MKATMLAILLFSVIEYVAAQDKRILIEDFASKKMNWYAKNDPVMGGKSFSTVVAEENLGKFNGEVVDVPFLSAPGFITMESRGGPYPDVSCCKGLEFVARASTPYEGYRFSFGMGHAPGTRYAFGYKTDFDVTADFTPVQMEFNQFSDNWDDATGSTKVTCAADKTFCPDDATLKDMGIMQFWGEGVDGVVDLEVKTVSAYGCSDECGGYNGYNTDAANGVSGGGYNGGGGGGSNGGGGNNRGGGYNGGGGNNRGGGNNGFRGGDSLGQGSAKEDIENTVAIPMAVMALLVSLISLFCIYQMRTEAKFAVAPKPVLTADTAVSMD